MDKNNLYELFNTTPLIEQWKDNEDVQLFINLLNLNDIKIDIAELLTLFCIYYNRNTTIELFTPLECFDNLYNCTVICIDSLNEFLLNDTNDNFKKFCFYLKYYKILYNEWYKVKVTKSIFPTLLQYYLFKNNDESILLFIKDLSKDYNDLYKLLMKHFGEINKEDFLILLICEYIIDHGFKEYYNNIINQEYEYIINALQFIKNNINDTINIDIDFFISNLKNNTLTDEYILSLFKFITEKINIKMINFYYDLSKYLYFKNQATHINVFIANFLSIVIKILLKQN